MMDRTTIESSRSAARPVGFLADAEAVLLVRSRSVSARANRALRESHVQRNLPAQPARERVKVAEDDNERQLLLEGRKKAPSAPWALSAPNYYVQDAASCRAATTTGDHAAHRRNQ